LINQPSLDASDSSAAPAAVVVSAAVHGALSIYDKHDGGNCYPSVCNSAAFTTSL
jgi:hypothetical protein